MMVAKWLWRFFSSVKLALILILVITGLGLLGALTTLNVFHSIIFFIPGILLMINIFICSLNRWKNIRAAIKGGEVIHPDNFYTTGKTNSIISNIETSASESSVIAENVLSKHGYRVRKALDGNYLYLAADKNRFYRLGTYFSHFSLILFVAAFLAGSALGFSDANFMVTEGETRQVEHGTNLSLKLLSFIDEYYPDGTPKDYRSQVVLYDGGVEVKQATIQVNHPLIYKGIRFYQSFFGSFYTAKMTVNDAQGKSIFDNTVILDIPMEDSQYVQGYFDLPDQGFTIRLIASPRVNDPIIPSGKIAIGILENNEQINLKLVEPDTPVVINGLEFTFGGIQSGGTYSGFQISRDPANAFIWIASILFIIGIIAVFYFPYREVWIIAQAQAPGSRLLFRSSDRFSFGTSTELNSLTRDIESKLPISSVKKKK